MVVRVKVQVKRGDSIIETSAVANSGYETEAPEIHLPQALARRLGFEISEARGARYRVVGGFTSTYVLGEILVRLITEDRQTDWVKAKAVSVPDEYEVLLSDKLLDALNIEIVRAGEGLWRFHGEPIDRIRKSTKPQLWIT
ncbi:MAG: hypothetical protein DRN15_02195 [Thermoprotei archaeon]|nr:MAG: hypothetical protein DRM97_08275 [Thermoprotei archaeon]RLF24765.1 MAG: hypothetical protein DRN15_02195 [Thermoprotei archaeon]